MLKANVFYMARPYAPARTNRRREQALVEDEERDESGLERCVDAYREAL